MRKEKGCGLTVKRIALPARPPTLLTSGGVGSVSLRLLENNARPFEKRRLRANMNKPARSPLSALEVVIHLALMAPWNASEATVRGLGILQVVCHCQQAVVDFPLQSRS